MGSRREFLKVSAAAAAVSRSVLGANDRVQMGVIGVGTRGNQVHGGFVHNNDVQFIAACDVAKSKLDSFATKVGGKIATYTDYRKLLENKDIQAVLITTPDHWHAPIMIAACEAGKDVYCEKPVSNAIPPALKMIEAARKYNRVAQVGLQQRSWQHFQDCAKLVKDGHFGSINQCVMLFGGGGGGMMRPPDKPGPPPADLDWEMFQGPAEKHEYVASRQNSWRGWYDYGGGSVTDWGVHLMDITMWYMDCDNKQPLLTSGMGQYISMAPDPERAPDTFSVVWKFDKFVATFTNAVPPSGEGGMSEEYGNYFYGTRGMLLVNRYGYAIRPNPPRRLPAGMTPPPNMPPQPPPIEAKKDMDPKGMSEDPNSKFGSATVRHTRNFLDCVKSRQRPVCDIEVGFNSSLPCLLANLSIRSGKTFVWDNNTKTAKAV